jgi:lipoate-protein ligase A
VGTAQVQKKYIIVHGTIAVDCDLAETLERISEFYRLAGDPVHLRRETMTTLTEELRRPITHKGLIEYLKAGHQSALGELEEEGLSADERKLAERLKRGHLL